MKRLSRLGAGVVVGCAAIFGMLAGPVSGTAASTGTASTSAATTASASATAASPAADHADDDFYSGTITETSTYVPPPPPNDGYTTVSYTGSRSATVQVSGWVDATGREVESPLTGTGSGSQSLTEVSDTKAYDNECEQKYKSTDDALFSAISTDRPATVYTFDQIDTGTGHGDFRYHVWLAPPALTGTDTSTATFSYGAPAPENPELPCGDPYTNTVSGVGALDMNEGDPGAPPDEHDGLAYAIEGDIGTQDTSWSGSEFWPGESGGWDTTVTWSFSITPSCSGSAGASSSACAPSAVIAPLPAVSRDKQVTLDGSASTAGSGYLKSYDWTFRRGSDCPAEPLYRTTSDGSDPRFGPFTVLCSLNITLTVTNNFGRSASTETTVTVTPRGAPFTHLTVTDDPDPLGANPVFTPVDPDYTKLADDAADGLSFSTCKGVTKDTLGQQLCPLPAPEPTPYESADAYQLDVVDDASNSVAGPFENWAFVLSAHFTDPRSGEINKTTGPNGAKPPGQSLNTYAFNVAHNRAQFLAWRAALLQHENSGDGSDHTGHISSAQEQVDSSVNDDPNVWLEDKVAATKSSLTATIEAGLQQADTDMINNAADPLTAIGTFTVIRYTSPQGWVVYNCTVGRTDGGVSGCNLTDAAKASGPKKRGQTFQVIGTTLTPGEPVDIDVHSETVRLATVTADANGDATTDVTIPADLTLGAHEITITGEQSGVTTVIPIDVQDASASPPPGGSGSAGSGGGTGSGAGTDSGAGSAAPGSGDVAAAPSADAPNGTSSAASRGGQRLADTGSDAVSTVALGVIALLAGVIAVVHRRRSARRAR